MLIINVQGRWLILTCANLAQSLFTEPLSSAQALGVRLLESLFQTERLGGPIGDRAWVNTVSARRSATRTVVALSNQPDRDRRGKRLQSEFTEFQTVQILCVIKIFNLSALIKLISIQT